MFSYVIHLVPKNSSDLPSGIGPFSFTLRRYMFIYFNPGFNLILKPSFFLFEFMYYSSH